MKAATMPMPLYDNDAFFFGYARLRENPLSANDVIEIPAMRGLLPPQVEGLRVLDLGCGTGGFCRFLAERGAASVVGVDVSARMLDEAKQSGDCGGRTSYIQSGIENYDAPTRSFDLVVSSLALHYVADVAGVFARASKWLSPAGTFVFSTEHPLTTASLSPFEGWERDSENQKAAFRVNHYFDEGERVRTWIVDGVTTYHRTLSTYLNALTGAGFSIVQIAEPTVSPEFAREYAAFQSERHRPLFLCVKAEIERH